MGLGWSHPCGAPERPPNSGPTTAVPRRVVPRRVGVVRQSALGRGGAEARAFALYPGAQAVPGWCLPRGRGWVHLGSRRARASAPQRYRAAFLAFAIDDPLASETGRHTRSTESPLVTHGRGINPFLNSPISYFHPIH